MDVSLFRHDQTLLICVVKILDLSLNFQKKNKNVNFLHGNIEIFTRVGLILTKNNLFWILNVFPVVLEIYYLNVLENGKKVWIWRQKIFK